MVFRRPKLTIGTKLVTLIAVLLMGSVASLVWLSTRLYVTDNTATIQQVNADTADGLATRYRDLLSAISEKLWIAGALLTQGGAARESISAAHPVVSEMLAKDQNLLGIYVRKHSDDGGIQLVGSVLNPLIRQSLDPDGEGLRTALTEATDHSTTQVSRGDMILARIQTPEHGYLVALGIPLIEDPSKAGHFTHSLIGVLRGNVILAPVADAGIVTSSIIDSRGYLFAHPEAARVSAGEGLAYLPIVKQMLEGGFNNGQSRYVDPQTGEAKLGAFRLVGFGGLAVVSEVPEAKAFEAAKLVARRSIYVGLIILGISFLAGYLYSGTLTWPIRQLVDAARRISDGDFKISLVPKSRDEIATLAHAFNDMARGLEERDRVKATFAKFHNKEIADKLLSGEVKLGGERREATIFFSDVRGFTAMSESMDPAEVVDMLNEYMTRMVTIIRSHNGVVDKYVGDAIMAIWGIPLPGEDDVGNAVRACLAMREELARLNELRISRGQSALRIGMGLNTGEVIAGNIGSEEKMEYTVIGDAVNLASRMESMTKEYGTDLLIPKVIQERLEGRFVFQKCPSARVKGKATAIEIFKIRGRIESDGKEVLIETPYSNYESEKSDKVVHDDLPKPPPSPANATPPPFDDVWFVSYGSESVGPFTARQIREGLERGEFDGTELIRRAAPYKWQAIQVHEAFAMKKSA